MDILHFCPSRSFSGLEQYALQLAADQKQRGFGVGFVAGPGTPLEEKCKSAGIRVIRYTPFELMGTVKFWPVLKKILQEETRLKVIHVHSTQEIFHLSWPVFARKWTGHPGPKLVLQSHIWVNHRKKDPWHRFLYSIVDEVWCSSEAQKKSLASNLPVPDQKIKLISYGRDVETLEKGFMPREDARRILRLPQDATVLGTVSRIEESKGIREFLDAGVALMDEWESLQVAVIGGPSPGDPSAALYASELSKCLEELPENKRKRFHLPGPVQDSYKFLKAFDLYVLPSYQETFSLSLLDAQLASLPVVGCRSGGTPDVVRDGETGWLSEPKSAAALGGKIREALLGRDQWEAYGAKAAARVRADYNQKRIFSEIIREYGLAT